MNDLPSESLRLDSPYDHVATGGPFSWDELFEFRRDFPEPQGLTAARVCVVGGGVAGLCAAYELSRRGASIKLLEASDRCGGRILTHRFEDGTYGELGAMRIPVTHQATLDYVERFGLVTRPFVGSNPDGYFLVGKQHGRIRTFGDPKPADTKKLRAAYPKLTLSPEELRASPFDLLLKRIVHPIFRPLTDAERWNLFASGAPTSPAVRNWEQHSLRDFLTKELAFPLSEQDWAYIGRATGLLYLSEGSFSQFVLDLVPTLGSPMVEIVGGMEQLPEAFLRRLGHQMIERHCKVTAINVNRSGVRVTWNAGGRSPQKEQFDYVICTAPIDDLRRIGFVATARDVTEKKAAWNAVTTEPLAKMLFHCSRRFWETEDEIYGGKSFTDEPIQQCYYPSDNSRRERTGSGANRWVARDRETSLHSGVFTAAYMWGDMAEQFGSEYDDDTRFDMVLRGVNAIHARGTGKGVSELVVGKAQKSWRPGFTYFGPGHQEQYQATMQSPLVSRGGTPRVFFAGEHLGIMHGWILSSIVTALAAVRDVLIADRSNSTAP